MVEIPEQIIPFSLRKAIIFKQNLKIWDYAITGLGLFLHEHKMSKTFFFCHVVKEKEKISGDHFMPSGEQNWLLSSQMMPVSESLFWTLCPLCP